MIIHLRGRYGRKPRHSVYNLVLGESPAASPSHLRHQLEVVDVVGGRERVEEDRLFPGWVREGVRRASRYHHIVPSLCVDVLPVRRVEPDCTLGHEERFIVHYDAMLAPRDLQASFIFCFLFFNRLHRLLPGETIFLVCGIKRRVIL